MNKKLTEPIVFNLGWLMARITGQTKSNVSLLISCPSEDPSEDCPTFSPAQSIRVWGEANLRTLQDKLSEYLKTIPNK